MKIADFGIVATFRTQVEKTVASTHANGLQRLGRNTDRYAYIATFSVQAA